MSFENSTAEIDIYEQLNSLRKVTSEQAFNILQLKDLLHNSQITEKELGKEIKRLALENIELKHRLNAVESQITHLQGHTYGG